MRRTPQQWLTLFQNQQDSDLSIKQFCLEHGISMSNFYKNKAIFKTQTSTASVSPFSQVYSTEPEQPSPPIGITQSSALPFTIFPSYRKTTKLPELI